MEWFLKRLEQTNPTLDYQDLFNHADDFKKLSDLKIIKHLHNVEELFCEWCDDPHPVSLFHNKNREIILSCSGNRRVVKPDELKVWMINRDTLIENVKSKKPIINKEAFVKTGFASKESANFRITKKGDDFYYKGDIRTALSRDNDWYKVFDALYDLVSEGGEISYTKLGKQIKSKIKKTKNYNTKTMTKFIQTNLTDRSNGFMHYTNIPENEDNGKPLLYVNRGKGIIFNNKV